MDDDPTTPLTKEVNMSISGVSADGGQIPAQPVSGGSRGGPTATVTAGKGVEASILQSSAEGAVAGTAPSQRRLLDGWGERAT